MHFDPSLAVPRQERHVLARVWRLLSSLSAGEGLERNLLLAPAEVPLQAAQRPLDELLLAPVVGHFLLGSDFCGLEENH